MRYLIKRIASIIMTFLIVLTMIINIVPTYVYATDICAPVINVQSLKVDKKQVKIGDSVKVSIRITDEAEIKHVFMFYQRPQTKNTESMVLTYNNITGYYEGKIEIKETSESGIWKISWIKAEDIYDNQIEIHNSNVYDFYEEKADLSAGDFEVEGTEADIHAPVIDIESLKVSKNQAGTGDKVKISIRITDETEIKHVFMFYQRPQTKNTESMVLKYNNITGYYEGEIEIKETSESGIWKISWMKAEDIYDNQIEIHNSNVYDFYEEKADLSAGDFEVYIDNRYENIIPLSDVIVYNKNTSVYNTTINGDVYVGPEAIVTLSNVVVTGNIYVLGGLKVSNIKAAALYGRYMTYGYITSYRHGEVSILGSNTFSEMMSFSSDFCPEMPLRVDEAVNIDGRLYMKGATADIADMYIDGVKINTGNNGKFIVDGHDIGNAEYVTLQWNFYDGTIKKQKIALGDKDGNIPLLDINISQSDIVLKEGNSTELIAEIFPYNTTESKILSWRSDNNDVVMVDSNGIITAKKTGKAVVTVTTANGKSAICTVRVVEPYVNASRNKNVYDLQNSYKNLGDEISVLDSNGIVMNGIELLKTGCILQYKKDNSILETSFIVVKGDVDGNGSIDVLDMEAIQKSILGIGDKLSGAYKEAASLTDGDDITVLDMEAIQKDILGIQKIN